MSEAHPFCDELDALLSAYCDGEVTPVERAFVESHLAVCAECRDLAHELGRTISLAAMLPELDPPLGLRAQILDRTVFRRSPWERARESIRQPALWRPALAMVTVGVAGLALMTLHGPHPNSQSAKTLPATRGPLVAALPEPTLPSPVKPEASATGSGLDAGRVSRFIHRIHDRLVAPKLESSEERATPPSVQKTVIADLPTEPSPEPASWKAAPSAEPPATPKPLKNAVVPKIRKSAGKGISAASYRTLRPAPKGRLEIPEIPPDDSSLMPTATAPPLVPKESPMGMPAQPMPTKTESHKDDEQLAEAPRPDPSLVEELREMSALKKKPRNSMEEVVAELNASASSPTRQVEWKIAKIKF